MDGQDLLKDSFSGNVRGMGPGVAEIEMEERPSEVFLLLIRQSLEHLIIHFGECL